MLGVFYPGQPYPAQAIAGLVVVTPIRPLSLCDATAYSLMPDRTVEFLLCPRTLESLMPDRTVEPFCEDE